VNAWNRLGAAGWSYRDVLPYFRRYERYRGGESQFHGGLGEFEVSDLRNDNPASKAWGEAGGRVRSPTFAMTIRHRRPGLRRVCSSACRAIPTSTAPPRWASAATSSASGGIGG